MTCIGASGPLIPEITEAVHEHDLSVVSVLSGNRNFDGRINPDVRMNYLASPPLVVAYALAGTMDTDLVSDPLGTDQTGSPVYLRRPLADLATIQATIDVHRRRLHVHQGLRQRLRRRRPMARPRRADRRDLRLGRRLDLPAAPAVPRRHDPRTRPCGDIEAARVLVKLGDSVTTDHVSPAGAIPVHTPAGQYLTGLGVERFQLNTYASRRGNHEVMMRGTFANVRLRNQLVPGVEGGFTRNLLSGETSRACTTPRWPTARPASRWSCSAGKDYGSGSSRDWAAKGPALLGVRAVLAESFERIHRSNLIGMGILPAAVPARADTRRRSA